MMRLRDYLNPFKREKETNEVEEDIPNEIVLTYELNDEPFSNERKMEIFKDAYPKIEKLVKKDTTNSTVANDYILNLELALSAELDKFSQEYKKVQDEELKVIIGTPNIPGIMSVGNYRIKIPDNLKGNIDEVFEGFDKNTIVYADSNNEQEIIHPIPYGVAVSVKNIIGDDLYIVVGNLDTVAEVDENSNYKTLKLPTKIPKGNIYNTTPEKVEETKMKYRTKRKAVKGVIDEIIKTKRGTQNP